MQVMRSTMWMTVAALMLGLSSAGAAWPDDDEAVEAEAADAASESPLLAGPEVKDEPTSADNPAFGGEDRMRQTVGIPNARWFMVLREIELTAEQREQAEAIAREYQQATGAFRREHADALRALQERIRQSRETGEFDPKLREEYREIQSQSPDAQPYQDRIWQLLDADQQASFRTKLEEVRNEIAERRARERDDQLISLRRGGGDAMTPVAEAMGEGDDGMTSGDGARPARDAARRGGRGMRAGQGLDEMSRRRLAFLRSKQSGAPGDRAAAPDGRRGRGADAERRAGRDRARERQRDREPAPEMDE